MDAERRARSPGERCIPAGALVLAGMLVASFLHSPTAGAATVVGSSLTVAGPVTAPCPTPSATINAPARSTVRFSTSLIGSASAPITNLVLAPAVQVVLNRGARNQVVRVISYAPNAPRTVDVTVPASGRVPFSYVSGTANAQAGGLLGGALNLISQLASSFRAASGVGAGVSATWSGQIVVGTASNGCAVQPQVPAVTVSPTVPGVTVPPVRLPGVTPPAVTLPAASHLPAVGPVLGAVVGGLVGAVSSAPTAVRSAAPAPVRTVAAGSPLAGAVGSPGDAGSVSSSGAAESTGAGTKPASTDAAVVGPSGPFAPSSLPAGSSGGFGGSGAAGPSVGDGNGWPAPGTTIGEGQSAGAGIVANPVGSGALLANQVGRAPRGPKIVEIASSRDRSVLTVLPTFLVVLAMLALSMATACFTRTFLLRRPTHREAYHPR
ncbi:MAG: hypothetical protein JWN95_3283 [Frankiales bacterium]|nr:hypothetical protein [Frankiales bacterium]